MSLKTEQKSKWTLASYVLNDAYTDFILSRQALQCSPSTLEFYKFTAGRFLNWLELQAISEPGQIHARHIRAYLAELASQGLSEWTIHDNARAIKTLLRFWFAEKYISSEIQFQMPRVSQKRQPSLDANMLTQAISECQSIRDKAILLLMADTGLRRAETISLNWGDLDILSGLIRVRRGKGGKARSVVIGATTRRAIVAYRRTLDNPGEDSALFQTRDGGRFSAQGLLQVFRRLSKRTGLKFTPHVLRRTFVILSLRAGMDVLHLQALLGHASLDMVKYYAQMVDDDLLETHKTHSPIENLGRLTRQ